MKHKHITLAALLFLAATPALCQPKQFDQKVGLSLYSQAKSVTSDITPMSLETAVGVDYAYFVSNHFALGASVEAMYSRIPIGITPYGFYEHEYDVGLVLTPQVSYYHSLTDRLYWNATAGFNYIIVSVSGTFADAQTENMWGVSLSPFGLHYKLSEKLTLSASLGDIALVSFKRKKQMVFQLNKAGLALNFWF